MFIEKNQSNPYKVAIRDQAVCIFPIKATSFAQSELMARL